MSNHPAQAALVAALGDWRRHFAALVIVVLAFGIASLLASDVALYGAYLVTFAVWMGWFVLTAIDWIRRADF